MSAAFDGYLANCVYGGQGGRYAKVEGAKFDTASSLTVYGSDVDISNVEFEITASIISFSP